ncbi:type 4a pilus biogenesis protein PilO [Anaerosoma tenue]|uniref:type 4a pilus biogenesis protein PilO n=1 Tax=Anaerosoma tenue TaxID=2933588 RepID=UPI0022608D37|nr:type 4a pilus biogenesis protein PilO [Anaerosoma tenue]MCK8114409.1 type 4a pilus biogenesis protein PilO [Anaerosoma tenue]
MNRLSAQMQMYIAIGVIAVLTIAFVVLAILPKFQQASAVDTEIAAAQTELQTAQALLARRQSVKAQAAANEVELMQIANQVPDSPQLPSVIIELQDVANAAGVELPTISVGDISAAPVAEDGSSQAYDVVELTVGCTGQWADVIDFCRRVNNLDRGTRVTVMTFTYVPETEEVDAYIDVSGTIEVYVMAAASTEAPAAQ